MFFLKMWYCLPIVVETICNKCAAHCLWTACFCNVDLLRQIGINVDCQFIILRPIYCCFLHYQFPKLVLLSGGQHWVAIQNVLGHRDNLCECLTLFATIVLLAKKICFCGLKLFDLFGQRCISLGKHIDGVHTLLQILADVFLLKLELGELSTYCFQCGGSGIDLWLLVRFNMNRVFIQPLLHGIPDTVFYVNANQQNFGDGNAESLLEMLFNIYTQFNGIDNAQIRKDFETLYAAMNGKTLKEMDEIIYPVCSLCRDHEKAGVVEGIKVGIRLQLELAE